MASGEPAVFVEVGPAEGHRLVVGGMTVLERVLWGLGKAGVARAAVAAPAMPLRGDLPLAVDFVAPDTNPPSGARIVRGDELEGIRVEDETSRDAAEWAVLRSLAKGHQGPVDATINWRFSMRLTRALARTRITPNHVSIFGLALGALACVLAVRGTFAALIVAGLIMQIHNILDSVDGELARLKKQYSKVGQWLDNLADDVLDNAFVLCAGIGAGGPYAALGVLGAGGRWFCAACTYLEVYRATGSGDVYAFRWWFERDKQSVDEVYDTRSLLTWVRALGRRDTYVFAWMLLCLGGFAKGVVIWGAVLGVVYAGLMLAHLANRTRAPRETP